jgi:hypothetical protein
MSEVKAHVRMTAVGEENWEQVVELEAQLLITNSAIRSHSAQSSCW